jgi:integrase
MIGMRISKAFMYKSYTEEELQSIIQHLFRKKELSESSKKQYSIKISQWISYISGQKTLHNLIYNPKNSLNILEITDKIKHSASNHHIYISSVVAFIKYVIKDKELLKEWKEIERTNWKPIADHYDKNEPTELQKEKLITLEEIEGIRRSLEVGSFERLLIGLYTLIEPIRADYFATEIIKDENEEAREDNYIILSSGKIVVKDFKTKKRYEKIENRLTDELMEELKISLERYPRKYLFTQPDNENNAFTRKLFSNWACRVLTRVLKQPMSLTVLRHIYITNKMQNKTSSRELIAIASKMGHSRLMQRVYEWDV